MKNPSVFFRAMILAFGAKTYQEHKS